MTTQIPKLVAMLTHHHEAWVVGSAASPDNTNPRDYDVVVPLSQWQAASALIPMDAVPNTFGGWKIKGDVEIDVWPGDLGFVMKHPKSRYAWSPSLGVRLKKEVA